MRYLSLDFEFQVRAGEALPKLVCAALYDSERGESDSYYLGSPLTESMLRNTLLKFSKTHIFLSYSAQAEISCLMALGLNPKDFFFIDLMVEWRMLRNANPKWNRLFHGKSPEGLANAQAGLIGIKLDLEEKERMRKLVVDCKTDNPADEIKEIGHRAELLEYCRSDIKYLQLMLEAIHGHYVERNIGRSREELEIEMAERGHYVALMTVLSSEGIPIDADRAWTIQLENSAAKRATQEKLRESYPELFELQRRNDPHSPLVFKIGRVRAMVAKLVAEGLEWPRNRPTPQQEKKGEEGTLQTTSAALRWGKEVLGVKSEILDGALAWKDKEESFKFWTQGGTARPWYDFVGWDGRLRPRYNPFGSSTWRNYPPAKSFFPACADEVKRLIELPVSKYLVQLDYAGQEFLINALRSGDSAMLSDYASGDPHKGLAIRCGKWDGKKETRHLFKQTNHALSFGLGIKSFMWRLRQDSLRYVSYEEAEELYHGYWGSYSQLKAWREELWARYQSEKRPFIKLEDGCIIWEGVKKPLSLQNFPIQATGGVVLRKAQLKAWHEGLEQAFPFHDAIYFWSGVDPAELKDNILKMHEAMNLAWTDVFGTDVQMCRIDGKVYGRKEPLDLKLPFKMDFLVDFPS